jgi:hypothetical protein
VENQTGIEKAAVNRKDLPKLQEQCRELLGLQKQAVLCVPEYCATSLLTGSPDICRLGQENKGRPCTITITLGFFVCLFV